MMGAIQKRNSEQKDLVVGQMGKWEGEVWEWNLDGGGDGLKSNV